MNSIVSTDVPSETTASSVLLRVLAAISFCHLLNDMVQALLPSLYPILKSSFHLTFGQIGILTLTYQITASLLQPVVGQYTDRNPLPFSLPIGMGFTLSGLILLSMAPTFGWLLLAATLVGVGSSVFHPESSRVARMASGGRHGFAQSFFQVGGNTGSAIGPLLAAFVVLPHGQPGILWFTIPAIIGIIVLTKVGLWSKHHLALTSLKKRNPLSESHQTLSRNKVFSAIA